MNVRQWGTVEGCTLSKISFVPDVRMDPGGSAETDEWARRLQPSWISLWGRTRCLPYPPAGCLIGCIATFRWMSKESV